MHLHYLTTFIPAVVTVDKVDQLTALVVEVAADWCLFLGQLGVSKGKRDELSEEMAGRSSAAQKCLLEGLHHWVVSNESPTYEKIIAVFNGNFLTNRPLARKVEEFAQSVETVPHASTTDDVIAGYADQMRGYYRTAIPQCFSLTWPPPPTRKVFNLSMISHKQYNYGRGNDELVRLLHLGNIEEIVANKSNIELKNLFGLDEAKRKVVLIEGAPGAGKSTLAWHICQKWEAGELFQEFKLVVFVQLRDPAIQSAKSLADLFPAQLKSVAREVVSRMETKGGEGSLFVLDGWDEFTPGLHGNELINNLFRDPSAIAMPSSTLVITSRPIASGDLHRYASSRVETIGFKQAELNLYLKEALENDPKKVQKLHVCLKERPVIKASCYLPLNTVIVVHLFLSLDNRLPNTLHGVFLQLVIHCIVRHIMKQQDDDSEPPRISSLDDLPPDMQTQLSHICAMAYHSVMKNKVTFSEDDLKSFNLPPDISTLSLIQVVVSFMPYRSRSYNFLHLSVQELLTSYHISKLSPEEQVEIFKDLFGQARFAAVFQYYAAFTKLQTAGIQDIIVSIIEQRNKSLLLTLLHCLYEAQDSSLCQFVASELKGELDLSGNSLSPVDCIAVGYFLHQCATICPMIADLSNCSLDSYKLELLGKELKRPIQAVQFEVCIDLSSSRMDGNLTRLIATELIASASVISKLDLSDNPIQRGEDGLSHLCQALVTNTSLVELNLSNCKLTITEENGLALSHMMKTNKTLKSLEISPLVNTNGRGVRYLSEGISSSSAISKLDLSGKPIQDGEDGLSHLCQALTTNTSLVELNLSYCKLTITEENGQALSHMLKTNKTLKSLLVLPIVHTDGHGLQYFLEYINTSLHAISKLDLSHNPIQNGKDGLSHLCQALTSNTSLVELNLSNCELTITKENGQALSRMLKTNKTLNVFSVSHNSINGSGVRYLSKGISSSAISKLDLSQNPIQDVEDGLSHLCQALTTNTSLVAFNFAGFALSVYGRRQGEMAEAIKSLQVSYQAFTGHVLNSLSYFIGSSSAISKLDLSRNPIQDGEDGLSHLCQALTTNTSLVELNLSRCELTITEENGQALSHMLKTNKTLNVFTLSWSSINGQGVLYLSEGISSSSAISKLDLSYNPIQDSEDGLSHLCQALTTNTSLVELNLSNCKLTVTEENGQALTHMLKTNKTLKSLMISPLVNTNGRGVRYISEGISSSSAISKLDLSFNPIQDGEDGLSHLCQALTTNTSLVELNLSKCKLTITEENDQALSHMLNKTLNKLTLSHNSINGRGIRYLSEGISSSSAISKLDLSGNPIQDGEDGLSHLCQALTTNTYVEELNLSHCKLTITKENGQVLSRMLKTNKTLNVFSLSRNSINGRGVRYLSEGISSCSAISKLDLSLNPIQDVEDGLSHLCQALTTNTSLVELNFAGFALSVYGRRHGEMAEAIKSLQVSYQAFTGHVLNSLSYFIGSSSAISKLDLSRNPIQDDEDGLSHLCQALATNTSLVELNLSNCKLHQASGPALRHMLETNKTLTALNLSRNPSISEDNVAIIAEGLRNNHTIKCLNLCWCGIHDTGMKSLADCLMVNDSLEELDLWNNTISRSPEAARGFSDMLKRNRTLKKLNVSCCELTDEAVKPLASALEVNSSLEELDLSNNIDLTDTALVALGESLKRNTRLKTVGIGKYNDHTTAKGWRQFVQCLKHNHSLELLRTGHRELNVEDVNTVRREKDLPQLRHERTNNIVV